MSCTLNMRPSLYFDEEAANRGGLTHPSAFQFRAAYSDRRYDRFAGCAGGAIVRAQIETGFVRFDTR
jgi:hypothetical protein